MNTPFASHVEECLRLACLLEAAAPKPGNVHPNASFEDLCYSDLVRSAEIVAPILSRAKHQGIGRSVLEAARQTQDTVGRNTNLGILLLLAPLAAVPDQVPLSAGIVDVLNRLTQEDASLVYRAVRLSRPGGMGRVPEQDVSGEPTKTLLEVMQMAAERDSVAAQYATEFQLVLRTGVPVLVDTLHRRSASRSRALPDSSLPHASFAASGWSIRPSVSGHWNEAIVRLHLILMARVPDTLIARKCGRVVAQRSAEFAEQVLQAGWPETQQGRDRFQELDRWLRDEQHRRNPGTTADLVAACLFAALRDRHVSPPAAGQR